MQTSVTFMNLDPSETLKACAREKLNRFDRYVMKTSPSRSVPKRNTQKADLKETTIVWIVANSLFKEYDSNEARGREAKHG